MLNVATPKPYYPALDEGIIELEREVEVQEGSNLCHRMMNRLFRLVTGTSVLTADLINGPSE
jgi:hypothetical protein